VAKGDLRHVAGNAIVPKEYWAMSGVAANSYQSTTTKQIHNFRNSWGARLTPLLRTAFGERSPKGEYPNG
jgi:hypothetical protein